MSKLKILFQEPFVPKKITYGKFHKSPTNNTFPYGVACIASYINKHGFEVAFLEPNIEGMSWAEYEIFLKNNEFNIVAIGSTTIQIDYAIATFEYVKKTCPEIITVLGGVHATLLPKETISMSSAIDYLVLGEGEKPFLGILECLCTNKKKAIRDINGICFKDNGSLVITPPTQASPLLPEDIPIPMFDIFPMRKYIPSPVFAKEFPSYSILASRGCPYRCAFCNANAVFGRKIRFKPVDVLLAEISMLKEKFSAKGIMFLDSTLTVNGNWVRDFCMQYKKSGIKLPWSFLSRTDTVDRELLLLMKEAGAWNVQFGIESGNQTTLDLMKKGTTVEQNRKTVKLALELGYNVSTTYILCWPGETIDAALNTIEFAKSIGNHVALFFLPVPFPKTDLWEQCEAIGGLRKDAKWSEFSTFDMSNPVFENPLIGKENMQKLLRKAYVSFYFNPTLWYRNFKDLIIQKQSVQRYIHGFKAVCGII